MLVERDEHLAKLNQLRNECLAGKGKVAILDGPFASGKTELLRTFARRTEKAGALVLEATCSRAETNLPFGLISQLLRSTARPAEFTEPLAALLEDGISSAAVPDGAATEGEGLEPHLVQTFHEVCVAILQLAAETPLLIAIDDLQHADVPSRHCLLQLIRRVGSSRVLVVLTDNMDMPQPHLPFRAELMRQPHLHRIRLAPLSRNGVGQFLERHLDAKSAPGLMPEFYQATGGNPLLLRALVDDRSATGDGRLPGYGLALLSCLHRGDPVMFPVARALAVLGRDSTPAELGRLVGVDAGLVEQALRSMTAAGLLGDGFFRHQNARSAVLDDLSPRARADLHHHAARLLHDRGADATKVARHLVGADRTQGPWAVHVLVEAAEQALLDDGAEFATACLTLAHRSATGEQRRAEILARLAHAAWQTDPSAAARHLTPLAAAALADRLDARDRAMLIRQLLWNGRTEEAVRVLDHLRASLHGPATDAVAVLRDIEPWLMGTYPPLSRLRQVQAAFARQRGNTTAPHADPWLGRTAALADHLARAHGPDAARHAERVLRDIRLSRTASWTEESAMLALLALACADRTDAAAAWCDKLTADAESRDAPTWQAMFCAARADIALRQGDLRAAAEHAQRAMTHLPPKSWGVAIGLPLGALILATTRMGRYEDAAKLVAGAAPDRMFQSRYGLHYLFARAHYYLATNHGHAALADFLTCGDLMRSWGLDVAGLAPWRTGAAEAWLELGNQDQAKQLIHDQLARPGTDGTRTRGLSLRLIAAISPPNRRLHLLTEALDLLESTGDRFEQARVLSDLSRAYHALGESRRARLLFRQALHVANACQAAPLAQELLSGSGEVTDIVTLPGGCPRAASLSDSERRVATLAVMGYTNREIASRLYVTPSTVEQHLTRVYRKLNVKGRKDLPADLWMNATKAG